MSEREEHGRPSSGGAIRRGAIPSDGVLGILRDIETARVTGELRFVAKEHSGVIVLERGQIAADQPESVRDSVEDFLALREGRFEVVPILPQLAGAAGGAELRTGVIGELAVADLMAYCERAGLTGLLRLERAGVRAEAMYDRGELTGLVVDGAPEDAVEDVFAWSEGLFSIEVRLETPEMPDAPTRPPNDTIPAPPPTMRTDTTQTRLLRVVEMSLADVLRKREERRPSVRPLAAEPSPEEGRKDATVRVVFLGDSGDALVGRNTPELAVEENAAPPAPARERERERDKGAGNRVSGPIPSEPPVGVPGYAIVAVVLLLIAGLAAFVFTLSNLR